MVCFCFLSSLKHSWGRFRISKHHLKRHPWPLLWVLSTVSVACTVALSPLLKFPKSTTVICRISGCKTWHRSMVLSHQCLQPARWLVGFSLLTFISVLQSDAPTAVALTLGLVQQTSPLLFSGGGGAPRGAWSNDATKRGAIACELLEIWPIWHSFSPYSRATVFPLLMRWMHFKDRRKECAALFRYDESL